MFAVKIKQLTESNENFRKVLHTGAHSQVVAMALPAQSDIGLETHPTADQILFFVAGQAEVVVGDETTSVSQNDVVFVPAGLAHNVTNTQTEPLKLFTVYAPPTHPDGAVHATKAEAELAEGDGDRD